MEFLIKPYKGLTTDEAVVAQCKAQLAGVLDIYEAWLSGSKYLGGDEILLADLHHVPIIDKLMQTRIKALFRGPPRCRHLGHQSSGRPTWQKIITA